MHTNVIYTYMYANSYTQYTDIRIYTQYTQYCIIWHIYLLDLYASIYAAVYTYIRQLKPSIC